MTRNDGTTADRVFTITIRCDNAAFDGHDCEQELARILRGIADEFEPSEFGTGYKWGINLYDINGIPCGDAEMVGGAA